MLKLINDDCLIAMQKIPDNSIDFILCDLPYGTTDCKWDKVIPFEPLWAAYKRIIKPNGVIALFANQPFTTDLIASNKTDYKYNWYWVKGNTTGFCLAKFQPMRKVEDICIFIKKPYTNNEGLHTELREYFLSELKKSGWKRKEIDELLQSRMSSHYFTKGQQFAIPSESNYKLLQEATGRFGRDYEDIKAEFYGGQGEKSQNQRSTYNPQGLRKLDKPIYKKARKGMSIYKAGTLNKDTIQYYTGYPHNVLTFKNEVASNIGRLHPTQKPLKLLEYLIKTYTNEGETVLDNCMGSGTTGIACRNTGRRFIGIEIDKKYYDIALTRLGDWYVDKEKDDMECRQLEFT